MQVDKQNKLENVIDTIESSFTPDGTFITSSSLASSKRLVEFKNKVSHILFKYQVNFTESKLLQMIYRSISDTGKHRDNSIFTHPKNGKRCLDLIYIIKKDSDMTSNPSIEVTQFQDNQLHAARQQIVHLNTKLSELTYAMDKKKNKCRGDVEPLAKCVIDIKRILDKSKGAYFDPHDEHEENLLWQRTLLALEHYKTTCKDGGPDTDFYSKYIYWKQQKEEADKNTEQLFKELVKTKETLDKSREATQKYLRLAHRPSDDI